MATCVQETQYGQEPTSPRWAGELLGESWPFDTGPIRRTRAECLASTISERISGDWYAIRLKPKQASVFTVPGYPTWSGF